MNFLSLLPAVLFAANAYAADSAGVKELKFVVNHLHSLCSLSLVSDYFWKEESYMESEYYGNIIKPFGAFFEDVRESFFQNRSWESTFWKVFNNRNHGYFIEASLANVEKAMEAVLGWYDIKLDGEVSKESVRMFLNKLYLKHYPLASISNFSDELMFIFLTYLVHGLDVSAESVIVNNNNIMDVDNATQQGTEKITDFPDTQMLIDLDEQDKVCAEVIVLDDIREKDFVYVQPDLIDLDNLSEQVKASVEVIDLDDIQDRDADVEVIRPSEKPMNPIITLAVVKVEYFAAKHLNHLYALSLLTDYFITDYTHKSSEHLETVIMPFSSFFQYIAFTYKNARDWKNTFSALFPSRVSMEDARKDVLAKYDIAVNADQTVRDRLQELSNHYYPSKFIVEDEAMHVFLLFLVYQLNSGMQVTYSADMMNAERVTIKDKAAIVKLAEVTMKTPDNFDTMRRDILSLNSLDPNIIFSPQNIFCSPSIKKYFEHASQYYKRHRQQLTTLESIWAIIFMGIAGKRLPIQATVKRRTNIISILRLYDPTMLESENIGVVFKDDTLVKDASRVISKYLKIPYLELRSKTTVFIVFGYLAYYAPSQ